VNAAGLTPFVDLRDQRRLRVAPDVHGAHLALRSVLRSAGDRFVLILGDVVDRGPDSGASLAQVLDIVEDGRGALLLGNHEWKLLRALAGRPVQLSDIHRRSLAEIEAVAGLTDRFRAWGAAAPLYALAPGWVFAHAAFDPAMTGANVTCPKVADRLRARALYGAPTGRTGDDGHPERSLGWVDDLPEATSMAVGHDCRSDTTVLRLEGCRPGTRAYLLDLGAGMGGPLAWLDLDLRSGEAVFSHPVAHYAGETRTSGGPAVAGRPGEVQPSEAARAARPGA
jgi:protein phosphatase